jgi:hypothetical protein
MIRSMGSPLRFAAALAFICTLTGQSGAFAETGEVNEDARQNSLRPGSWSIQFQVDEGISLKTFNGMMISLKRHFSRRSALRVGVGLSFYGEDEDSDYSVVVDDTLAQREVRADDSNGQTIELDALYLLYPKPDASVNLFVGVGPLVRYSRQERTQESQLVQEATQGALKSTYYRRWSLGALGAVGVEWFLAEKFSFHAEYKGMLAYNSVRSTQETTYQGVSPSVRSTVSSGSGWDFEGLSVTLGLSVYF